MKSISGSVCRQSEIRPCGISRGLAGVTWTPRFQHTSLLPEEEPRLQRAGFAFQHLMEQFPWISVLPGPHSSPPWCYLSPSGVLPTSLFP